MYEYITASVHKRRAEGSSGLSIQQLNRSAFPRWQYYKDQGVMIAFRSLNHWHHSLLERLEHVRNASNLRRQLLIIILFCFHVGWPSFHGQKQTPDVSNTPPIASRYLPSYLLPSVAKMMIIMVIVHGRGWGRDVSESWWLASGSLWGVSVWVESVEGSVSPFGCFDVGRDCLAFCFSVSDVFGTRLEFFQTLFNGWRDRFELLRVPSVPMTSNSDAGLADTWTFNYPKLKASFGFSCWTIGVVWNGRWWVLEL